MNLVHNIENHPLIALPVCLIHLGIAQLLNKFPAIPEIIMQLFQILAWSITITVGVISIYGTYKKWRGK